LLTATKMNNKSTTSLLIKNGADVKYVDEVNNVGSTSLHIASIDGHLKMFDLLLSFGANVNQTQPDGMTASMLAANNRNVEVVKQLMKSGAIVNQADENGATALMIAAYRNDLELIRFLVQHGAEDACGGTALTRAEEEEFSDVANFLNSVINVGMKC